jgi:3-methyladenine DNA glycosylase AlkD
MARSSAKTKTLLAELDERLAPLVSSDYQASIGVIVPTEATVLGVRVPALRALARELERDWEKPSLDLLIPLMDRICKQPHRERFLIATFMLARVKGFADDPRLWEATNRWIDAMIDWEMVDQFASAVAGEIVARAPKQYAKTLLEWTRSDNLWRRRFALICTIPSNHKGRKNPKLAIRVAKPLMRDEEPMVYKAVGFALREACRAGGEDLVFDFLCSVEGRAYRRTIVESAKKLSDEQKQRLLG